MIDHSFLKFYQQQPRADPNAQGLFHVAKADEERHMVFGWASVANLKDGQTVEDYQRDVIDIYDLEKAVYDYVLFFRDGGEMHQRRGVGMLVESVVFTREKMLAMGIPVGTVPYGWWIGLKITDDDVWKKIQDGSYRMFSIEGEGIREPMDDETEGEA